MADGRRVHDHAPGRPGELLVEAPDRFASAAAAWIASAIADTVLARGACSLALAGGSTPRAVYAELARDHAALPWPRVSIYFGDERGVPPSDPDSNFRMADATLLSRVPIPRAAIHRMPADRADRDAAAREYAALLPPSLDLLLLGMGHDGHTASLFPYAPALDERARLVVPSESPVPPTPRLTITPPVIAAARRIAVLVAGAAKAETLARVREGAANPRALPAQLALGGTWLVDDDAASMLQRRGA